MKNLTVNMIRIFKRLTGNHLLMFSLIFIVSTVFYSYKIGFSDLWSDETYTKSMLSGSPGDFYAMFRNDLHPPLYYIGLRIFTGLAGQSATAMRAFSVVGVLATLLLGYFAGQRIFGKRGGLLFCLLLASVPMLAVYSHQARMYTWAAFSVT
ncbi:MAG: glycosyltransferase family 39 protein, partial [Bacteroidales bacterium]